MWLFFRPLVRFLDKAILKKLWAVSTQWFERWRILQRWLIPVLAFRKVTSLDSVLVPTWNFPYPVAPPFESADTNWPTAEEFPTAFSSNCTSETMMLSARTEPQFVQTAKSKQTLVKHFPKRFRYEIVNLPSSPLALSTSISLELQFEHFLIFV